MDRLLGVVVAHLFKRDDDIAKDKKAGDAPEKSRPPGVAAHFRLRLAEPMDGAAYVWNKRDIRVLSREEFELKCRSPAARLFSSNIIVIMPGSRDNCTLIPLTLSLMLPGDTTLYIEEASK